MLLAQPSLNLNQQPIESRLRGGRMSTTRQYAIDCYGGTACSVDGGVLRIWTADAGAATSSGGGAPVDAGYVVWSSAATTGSTNERVLSAGNYTTIDNATAGQTQVDWAHGLTCAGGNVLTTNGTGAMICVNPVPDATAFVTGGIRLNTDLGGSATAPEVVDDSHNHTSSTISGLDVADITSGTLSQARGGTGAGALTCAAGERLTSNGTAYSCSAVVTQAYATVEDEATPLTQRSTVNFTGAGVSCTDSGGKTVCTISGGGGGGGLSPYLLSFGGF